MSTDSKSPIITFKVRENMVKANIANFILTLTDWEFTFKDETKCPAYFDKLEMSMDIHTETICQKLKEKLGIGRKDYDKIVQFNRTIKPEIQTELLDNKSVILAFAKIDSSSSSVSDEEEKKEEQESAPAAVIDPGKELDAQIPDRNYLEYVIKIINRNVKQDEMLVRLLVYVGLTVYSNNPLCLGIRAGTSTGKTHAVVESILKFFPKMDIIVVGSMSPKALIRRAGGYRVDEDNESVEGTILRLRQNIERAKSNRNTDRQVELELELEQLLDRSKYVIDMQGKILLFLEPPKPETFEIIKPMLSHDTWEIPHPFVDIDRKTKNVVTRGWPACIFCSAKDESKWDIWPEIQSRFLVISPTISELKFLEGNRLTMQKLGLPNFAKQLIIVSDAEVALAQKCIRYLQQVIKKLCPINFVNNNFKPADPVWIPYQRYLADSLPYNIGPAMRAAAHVGSLINIIALAKSPFILDTAIERQVIARSEDMIEALQITQEITNGNLVGIPKDKIDFLTEIFIPLFKIKTKPRTDDKTGKMEQYIAVEGAELADYYNLKRHSGISSDNLTKTYLDELIVGNLISKEKSTINASHNIYRPTFDLDDTELIINQRAKLSSNSPNLPKFVLDLHVPTLKLSKYYKEIPETWLIYEIMALARVRIWDDQLKYNLADLINRSEEFKLLERNSQQQETRLTARDFISRYESTSSVSIRAQFISQFYTFRTKHFHIYAVFTIINWERYKRSTNFQEFEHIDLESLLKNHEECKNLQAKIFHQSWPSHQNTQQKYHDSKTNSEDNHTNDVEGKAHRTETSQQAGSNNNNNPVSASGSYVAFDLEYTQDSEHKIFAAAFKDHNGEIQSKHITDFQDTKTNPAELQLLLWVLQQIKSYKYSLGWYSRGIVDSRGDGRDSDLKVIDLACQRYHINSPIAYDPEEYNRPFIIGSKHIDLHSIYSNKVIKGGPYYGKYQDDSLDSVAKGLGSTQGKFQGLSGKTVTINTPREITLQYVERDAALILFLAQREKFEILNLMRALATITKQTFERVCHTEVSNWWAQIIARITAKRSYIKKQKYAGAYIIQPKSGSYTNTETPIYVLDVKSMYPTQMINQNLSFETVNCYCCKNDSEARVSSQIMNIVNEGLAKMKPALPPREQAHWICRKVKGGSGIMPLLLQEFRAQKLAYEKTGNKIGEKAVKILINAAYGIFGTEYFKYRNYAVAELTTAFARRTLRELEELTVKHNLNPIYGDTDSIFVIADESKVSAFETEWSNAHPDITIDRKGIYSKMLLGKKKHYLLIPTDYPKSPAIVKGFEGKKSDRFEYIHQSFAYFIEDYAHGIDPTVRLSKRRLQLERGQVIADLLSTTIVLHKNPDRYSKGHVQYILGTKLGLGKGEPLTYWLGVDGAYESDPEHYSCAECLDKFDSTFEDLVDVLPDKNYRKHVIEEGEQNIT